MYWVDLLYLSLFARWHYVVGVLCGSVVQSPWSPVRVPGSVPHVCFVSSPVTSALIVFGMSVGGNDSQADWLQGLAMSTVYVLLWRPTPWRRDSPQWHFCLVRPAFGCAACEANWVVLCLVWSLLLGVLFLVPLGRAPVQAMLSHCLWSAQGYLVGVTKLYTLLNAVSAGSGGIWG